MKTQELRNLIREEVRKVLKETYNNPEWKLSSIHEAKLVKLKTALNAYPKSYASTAASKKIEIPKNAQIEIIEHPFEKQPNDSLIKYKGQEYVVVRSSLDKALGLGPIRPIKEEMDSKPIESFSEAKLKNILTKIGFPATKAEGYYDINAGPTLSVVFKNTLDDENEFMDAYADFQFDGGALGSQLPNIESAYHVGGKKWKFQMEK